MSIYQHFRKEEHALIDQVLDWKQLVLDEYRPKLTDFLDPREQRIVSSVVGKGEGLDVFFSGGQENAERKRAIIAPDYFEPGEQDFEYTLFELQYPVKFATLEHPKILGTLMGLGIKREKFGDILNQGDRFQIIVTNDIADYVKLNLESAGKTKIRPEEKPLEEILPNELVLDWTNKTVSSMRLDVLLSEGYNLSRSKAKPLIQQDKVKVNWRHVTDPSFLIQEEDVISLRGFGRMYVAAIEGNTRKGKIKLTLGFPQS